ncbi:MAG: hypothetical protein R6V58_03680 [Planctomycetota bacterium]
MAGSTGNIAFKLVDKVVVAVLAVLAVYYVGRSLLGPVEAGDPLGNINQRIDMLKQRQQASKHETEPLEQDYMTAAIGELRPDVEIVPAELPKLEREPVKEGERRVTVNLRLAKDEPKTDVVELEPDEVGGEIKNTRPSVASAERTETGEGVRVTALREGETEIRVTKDDRTVVISVLVSTREVVREIQAPPTFTVRKQRGQVALLWGRSEALNAEVDEYWLYRQVGEGTARLYLRATVRGVNLTPEEPPAAGVPLVTTGADGEPMPHPVIFDAGRFIYKEVRLAPEVRYRYTVVAVDLGPEGKPKLTSEKAGPVVVQVEETFQIEFAAGNPNRVSVIVIKRVPDPRERPAEPAGPEAPAAAPEAPEAPGAPEEPEPRPVRLVEVHGRFEIERGQPVGWVKSKHVERLPDGKVLRFDEPVDFSTGYRLLDILSNEKRVRRLRGREGRGYEENRQKVLLINRRGRIKVLWPARVMEKMRGREGAGPP